MSVPHPIPYQGSKRSLAPVILQYFPADTCRLIEPFAGSAALSLAAATHKKAEHFALNDINAPLMTLWHSIIHEPAALADRYETLWEAQSGRERRFYDLVRQRFNQTHRPYYFLYLLARCVKASVRYNANGEFNQSPDNRRKGRQPQAMRQDIERAAALLEGKTTLTAADYRAIRPVPHDLVYLDPPYQGVCNTGDPRYLEGVNHAEFVRTLHDWNDRGISYLVSYDGRTGNKSFGQKLPDSLNLRLIELAAGTSSQATLLGRHAQTYESLYLSPALVKRLGTLLPLEQMPLFEAFP
jgi:DNA adenine methylase